MPRVLHVDDEPSVRRAIQRTLGLAGLRVRSLESPAQAEAVLERETFDVAVIDRHIGPHDGVELIERLADRFPDLRLILLSGSLTPEVEERAYAVGASRCLSKSIPPRQLVSEVIAFAGGSGIVCFGAIADRATGT